MAGQASRLNGAKGGRPKGKRSLEGEMLRDYISSVIEKEKAPIISALIEKAKSGDVMAFKELMDRAYGKAMQPTDITSDGESIAPVLVDYATFVADNAKQDSYYRQ